MKLNPKQLAASAALLGVLACAAALPASAAGPVTTPLALTLPKVSFPWDKVTAESIETGSYDAAPLAGTAQQLSPVTTPANAASKNGVTYVSDNPNVVSVDSEGVAQAVGLGTANITATCGGVSCTYTITPQPDASMIATEMDITLASSTIAVGETTSLSLAVLPTSAANYINVSLSSSNEKVATVNNFGKVTGVAPGKATITGVATGATSVVVSNGTASTSVTVIVNRTASTSGSSSDTSGEGTEDNVTTDATVAAIQNAAGEEVSLYQSDVPAITGEILSALRTTGRSLIVLGEDYTLRIDGTSIKSTQGGFSTALTFAPDENGLSFQLGENGALPCVVQITLAGENAAYSRLYLHNTASEKWQFLNSYKDGTITADTAGSYLLTNQNLRFTNINWTFFIAAGALTVVCLIVYIAVKKRYWFW